MEYRSGVMALPYRMEYRFEKQTPRAEGVAIRPRERGGGIQLTSSRGERLLPLQEGLYHCDPCL
ncbi:hypothetical protein GMPD_23850 [Geomonas paludis]|uniref:Uncharacterized protein n=1 Tax=Geomonas paludis TaxID=2740185 RepID=A0A6V8MW94_9BACT|nr:hypothetical protein GMPD_23850 [Geomonas paludis]